jgi:transposase
MVALGDDESGLTLDRLRRDRGLHAVEDGGVTEAADSVSAVVCSLCSDALCRREVVADRAEIPKGGRRAAEVVLRTCERTTLERVARAATSSQRDALRARIVLLAAQRRSNREIAAELGVGAKVAGKWRRRFSADGGKALCDAPRSGRGSTYTAEAKAWYFQTVLESARDHGVPISRWTCKELVEFAKRAGMTPRPHPATLARWLRNAEIKPHRWRYWLKITDPDFETRMKDVTGLYVRAIALHKAGIPVFCVDEKTGMQALERETPDRPTRRGKVRRRDHRYKRRGTTCFIGVFEVGTGKVWGRFVANRDTATTAALIAEVCDAPSVKRAPAVHFVMDQLSTHSTMAMCEVVASKSGVELDPKKLKTGALRKIFLLDPQKRVVVHFTPLRASWLDQIEVWFSILSRKVLLAESFNSIADLQAKVFAFVVYYNRWLARPFRWTYTGAPCRT